MLLSIPATLLQWAGLVDMQCCTRCKSCSNVSAMATPFNVQRPRLSLVIQRLRLAALRSLRLVLGSQSLHCHWQFSSPCNVSTKRSRHWVHCMFAATRKAGVSPNDVMIATAGEGATAPS